MNIRFALVFAVCLFVSGCMTTPDSPNLVWDAQAASYETVLAKTKLLPDPHAGWTKVLGPMVVQGNAVSRKKYIVQGWIDRKRPDVDNTFQIQVSAGFPKRVFLKQAYGNGKELPTTVIDREPIDCGYGCTTIETVGIALSDVDMAHYAADGLSFEVVGRREDLVMTIPPAYFAAVLAFHRSHRGAAPWPAVTWRWLDATRAWNLPSALQASSAPVDAQKSSTRLWRSQL